MAFRPVRDDERLVILGHTGSGKSVAGMWHLSQRSWHRRPWIVFDPKYDELIGQLVKRDIAKEIDILEVPKKPGLYVTHPDPGADDAAVNEMLRLIWQRAANGRARGRDTGTGLYFDEGQTIPQRTPRFPSMSRIQMQGRSLHIPTIVCSQRPVDLHRSVWSEASFFQYYYLQDEQDRKRTREFANLPVEVKPPEYCSWFWDVNRQEATPLRPVDDPDTIVEIFRSRLGRRLPVIL